MLVYENVIGAAGGGSVHNLEADAPGCKFAHKIDVWKYEQAAGAQENDLGIQVDCWFQV